MPTTSKRKTTTERGLGYAHRKQRDKLMRSHVDGSPCPCLDDDACGPACLCRPHGEGQPMWRDAGRNADGMPLEADHTLSRSQGGKKADRLMLATCNRSRQDGMRNAPVPDPTDRPTWWSRDWY